MSLFRLLVLASANHSELQISGQHQASSAGRQIRRHAKIHRCGISRCIISSYYLAFGRTTRFAPRQLLGGVHSAIPLLFCQCPSFRIGMITILTIGKTGKKKKRRGQTTCSCWVATGPDRPVSPNDWLWWLNFMRGLSAPWIPAGRIMWEEPELNMQIDLPCCREIFHAQNVHVCTYRVRRHNDINPSRKETKPIY